MQYYGYKYQTEVASIKYYGYKYQTKVSVIQYIAIGKKNGGVIQYMA